MDVTGKLKKLWGSKSKKGFKGSGHVLGSAPPQEPHSAAANRASVKTNSRPSSEPARSSAPGRRLGSAGESPAASSSSRAVQSPEQHHTETAKQASSSSSPAALQTPPQSWPSDEPLPSEDVQAAVAQLRCDERPGEFAIAVLTRVLRNIVNAPHEVKYRKLRLQNAKIKEAVVDAPGGIEFLSACGFDLIFESVEEGQPEEGFAVLLDDASLAEVRAALYLISPDEPRTAPLRADPGASSPQPSSAASPPPRAQSDASSSSASPAQPHAQELPLQPPRARNTQVIVPTDSDTSVPDWVFERSPSELKAAVAAARRKREQGEVLMTRAMREKLALGDKRTSPAWGTVRVRMPEGLLLQGEFGASEPCAAIFTWLTDCLRDPGETYRLVQPRAGALDPGRKSMRDAGLLPSVMLHFQRDGATSERLPALSNALLAQAQPAS